MAINERDINIHLRLFDNFSSAAAKIQNQTIAIGQSMDQVGRQISQFGGKLTLLGGATTGAFLVAMKNIEGASPAVTRTFRELDNVMRNLQLSIAESAQPALQRMVDMFADVVDAWNELDPALRDSIIQFTFQAGAALLAGGAIAKLGGILISVVGKIITVAGSLLKKNLALTLVVTALGLMITHWDRVKAFVLPIVTALQIAGDAVAIAYLEYGRAIIWVTDKALAPFIRAALSVVPVLEATRVISKETADAWRKSLSGISENFEGAREAMGEQADKLRKDMKGAIDGTGRTWADATDKMVTGINNVSNSVVKFAADFPKRVGNGAQRSKREVQDWVTHSNKIVQDLANSMSSNLGNFFNNTLKGQVGAGKQFFVDFGNSVLQILTQVLAKLILMKTLGAALSGSLGFNPFKFHSGGVVKAHSGTLAQDEVPIIAQQGEGVLSRQGVNALGRGNLNRLNRGEEVGGGGGGSPIVVIQAWDVKDIQRNSKTIEKIIGDAMKQNSPLRGVMKQYG